MAVSEDPEVSSIIVLYVDDEPKLGELVAQRLEQIDDRISLITETRAKDGLEVVAETAVNCVISDYQMHGMDGLEFLEAARAEYPSLPFILYTGEGSEDVAAKAINKGVDAYVQKRFDSGQYSVLAKQIDTLVKKRRAEQRLDCIDRNAHLNPPSECDDRAETTATQEPSLSVQVVREIAGQEDIDPVELAPPLYDVIDPDALDSLVSTAADRGDSARMTISFEYNDYTVTIDEDGIALDKDSD